MRSGIKICVAWGKSIPETKTSAKASKLHLMRQEIARRLVWAQQSQHRDETHGNSGPDLVQARVRSLVLM